MRRIRRTFFLFVFTCLVGVAAFMFWPEPHIPEPEMQEDRSRLELLSIEPAGSHITQHTYQFPGGERPALYLYEMSPSEVALDLEERPEGPFILQWPLADDILLVNGFYFTETMAAAGRLWDEGEVTGGQAYDPERTAVVRLHPNPAIIDTTNAPLEELDMEEGGQTFPLLIKDGSPAVKEDSGRLARRTFIGFDEEGQLYIGIVPHHYLSLYTLSQLLPTTKIRWNMVANLDGGPSTGVFVPDGTSVDSFTPIPNVIRVRAATERGS